MQDNQFVVCQVSTHKPTNKSPHRLHHTGKKQAIADQVLGSEGGVGVRLIDNHFFCLPPHVKHSFSNWQHKNTPWVVANCLKIFL